MNEYEERPPFDDRPTCSLEQHLQGVEWGVSVVLPPGMYLFHDEEGLSVYQTHDGVSFGDAGWSNSRVAWAVHVVAEQDRGRPPSLRFWVVAGTDNPSALATARWEQVPSADVALAWLLEQIKKRSRLSR